MALRGFLCICCLVVATMVGTGSSFATPAPAPLAAVATTTPAADEFALESPWNSAVPTACRPCLYQTWECSDPIETGKPCGPDIGKANDDPTVKCRCGICNGYFVCKKDI